MIVVEYKDGTSKEFAEPLTLSRQEMAEVSRVYKKDPTYAKYVENSLQSFVHSMNHLSRNAVESPFTNISIFDRPKLRAMLDENELGWYITYDEASEQAKKESHKEKNWTEYVIKLITKLQEIYMKIMDAGVVVEQGRPFTFPVSTCLPVGTSLMVNDSIVKVEDIFRNAPEGWSEAHDLYTRDASGKKVPIKNIYRSQAHEFTKIKFSGRNTGELLVTPDHLCVLENGSKKKAKDLKEGDALRRVVADDSLFGNEKEISPAFSSFQNPLKADFRLGRLVGLFFSTYHSCSDASPRFSLSFIGKEPSCVSFLQEEIKALDPQATVEVHNENDIQKVMITSSLVSFLRKMAFPVVNQTEAQNMALNLQEILKHPKDFAQGILRGILEGCHDVSDDPYAVAMVPASEYGKDSLKALAALLNTAVREVKDSASDILEFSRPDTTSILMKKHIFVESVETIDKAAEGDIDIFNIEVNNPSHTYMLPSGIVTSNCNISRKSNPETGEYEIEDPEFFKNFCKNHDVTRYNIYSSEGMKIASCCRLVNDFDLFALGGQVNSFGGTALSLGSHRVCTINLRRIALKCHGFEDYLKKLKDRMDSTADILCAHRALIKDLTDKGLQPFIKNGWLDLNRMFSTIGLMGYYEADLDLKKRFGEYDYIKDILSFINTYALELTKKKGHPFNIEQIPGESMSWKLADTDRWIFGEEKVPEHLYANQFLPLFKQADYTIWEKMDIEGRLSKLLTGGGIAHISLGEKVTEKQAEKIIQYAVSKGLEHFALNPVYSICEDGHYSYGKVSVCPICKKPIKDFLTRTVGFMTKVSNWSQDKQDYDFAKRDYKTTEQLGLQKDLDPVQ